MTGSGGFLLARALAIGVLALDRAPLECLCGHDRDQFFRLLARLEPDAVRREAFLAYARAVLSPRWVIEGAAANTP